MEQNKDQKSKKIEKADEINKATNCCDQANTYCGPTRPVSGG